MNRFKGCLLIACLMANNFLLTLSNSINDCPEGWILLKPSSDKCVRFFDHRVNYTQADFICRDIADGQLLTVESREEQKALIAYLIGLVPMSRSPVTWIGVKVDPPNKIIYNDGSAIKYSNFGGEEIHTDEKKCVKIFSLFSKNDKSDHGMWSLDGCSYNDAGFVCQKTSSDSSRIRALGDAPYSTDKSEGNQLIIKLTPLQQVCPGRESFFLFAKKPLF